MLQVELSFNKWFLYDGEDDPPVEPDPPKTFTQEEVNRINKDERLKREAAETKAKELTGLIQDLQNKQNMSAEEQAKLVTKIEELENANLTAEQKLARQQEKAKEEYEGKIKETSEQASFWQSKFANERTRSALLLAAEGNKENAKAYNPMQIVDLLEHKTQLVPILDDNEAPTGEFKTVVKGFNDIDKDGNPISVDLDVSEAVNRMREMSQFANLFQNDQISGLDMMTTKKGKEKSDDDLTTAEYIARRKAGKLQYQRK